ncbi:methylenetetrahydrofolate reductase C-terminal domain-containing protein [Chloroflexota bacterium]
MKTITEQKPFDEISGYLAKCNSVYVIGCGTCATLCHTGGKTEIIGMKEKLEAEGKKITGWMLVPTACDELTKEALASAEKEISDADCVLALVCATGVQNIAFHMENSPNKAKLVVPGLNSLFLGTEETPGHFVEYCLLCGSCVLGRTAAVCPLVRCAKSLFNGPCGGSADGRCEISKDVPCAWQLIYDRLAEAGRLDLMDEFAPLKDWSTGVSAGPRVVDVDSACGIVTEVESSKAK